ncbi:2-succinyl-5-enolpyruvyl-6-hydroxy-3-cyclohexene-1-carboxylic-acid synthase [Clostridium estertheticum]|uniref:2-succinyl-5-enolpyruvyl-6-hydroxy-3- cyclohexene-1-carboxylic-acid synthase n=1 Tax=Clostridium estertheticum TaxID=238834 RepID=UPI001C7E0A07|nr:2-succinyl-5-enolpyruvyl-6-hydroxy-3-cyclohexene-1-carboxylic-acid synthase [Clostridium estertheticum]MBX4264823.1 2-succinyl-5-enolpyruvyl-6-hydroxy-3-cyclohexene-1-carboxylic-acid synthase [Clostridium estertheticum]WLC88305.1 2-succinyl-5-enolpyruvyl-6-hydroxy-3-cyclohexene-1-carboxylic-acid synthase [Clostridium estertheticum]
MTNYIAALVDELYQLGVREVVISPGSRSTPLSILFCEHDFNIFINVDERSAGFFALGIAKEQARPVVLVCTSGTAVANYLPAIVEAKYSGIPLIVLTADRPPELRNVGAPQTIDQNKIFGDFTKYYEELALPEESESMYIYVRTVMQRAFASAMTKEYGVIHINVPLRDPLIPDLSKLDFTVGRSKNKFEYIQGEKQVVLDNSVFKNKNGIIICGGDAYSNYHKEVIEMGERLKAPILADPISNMRNYSNDIIIDSYDAFLKNDDIKKELEPEYIIHIGQVPVSKRLQQFLTMHHEALYIRVGESFKYCNPSLTTNIYIKASSRLFTESICIENDNREYLDKWLRYQKQMREQLNGAKYEEHLFEGKLIQNLQSMMPEKSRLVVANSMAIRDIDYFFEARNQNIKVLCNRGANGIDGTVSTALGISTSNHPTVLLTGDLAFYHDLNGLLIGKTHKLNLIILLLNNDGGGIFRYLPQSKGNHFEHLFLTPQGINFEGVKTLYNTIYFEAKDYRAFSDCLNEALTLEGIKLIEVKIDLELSKKLHDKYTTL